MFINNDLRDRVYKNNLAHGFWDNIRPIEIFFRDKRFMQKSYFTVSISSFATWERNLYR